MNFAAAGTKRRIFGVDFSGAKNAGRKIWISEGVVEGDKLNLLNCYPISDISENNSKERNVCLSALRELIRNNSLSVFGMDFPFSIPEQLMSGRDWCSFISNFPDEYISADDFRRSMRSAGGKKELKRVTDTEVSAPFSIYNLWIYKQTYYGIRDVLRPLIMSKKICALPMQKPEYEKPWLMEICPASTLKNENLYLTYKGRTEKEKETREFILEEMHGNAITVPADIRDKIIKNKDGDALDSFIAAYATFRSVRKLDEIIGNLPGVYLREGYTFF